MWVGRSALALAVVFASACGDGSGDTSLADVGGVGDVAAGADGAPATSDPGDTGSTGSPARDAVGADGWDKPRHDADLDVTAERDLDTAGDSDDGHPDPPDGTPDGGVCEREAAAMPYASEVLSFEPGANAGFGADAMPDVVLGPPLGGSPLMGSLDVVSLGVGGVIVLGFGDRMIIDGPGADFVVFENAFWIAGDKAYPFAEAAEVAVSIDGETWLTFDCDPEPDDGRYGDCAGWRPRQLFDECVESLVDVDTGGDRFDLADVGLESARYVRITDLATGGAPPSAGFDLDAVGLLHWER